MKDTNDLARRFVVRGDVRAFGAIAKRAAVRKIIKCRLTSVLLSDNVIDFATEVRVGLPNPAVFAPVASTVCNLTSRFRTDVATH
jgi:hypothetical protein